MKHDLKGLGTYGTVGLELILSILLGLFGGQWLDKKFGTAPWLALIGLAFGTAAGVRSLLRALKVANREIEEEDRRERLARSKYHERAARPEMRAKPDDHSSEP
jgi:F0F1-type ATP synthase assembly protein I